MEPTQDGTPVAIVSLGCAKNLVDSEVMAALLREAGFRLTDEASRAEVLVVNTCGFIAPAQRESVETILHLARGKEEGRLKGLVVAGCLPRRFTADEVARELPEVDAVVGTAELPLIADVVRRVLRGERVVMAEDAPSFLYHHRMARLRATPAHLAYVKVCEGCVHPCTFCTIPRIRGPYRSRPLDSVVEEVQRLADEGVQEVVLIGQDTSMYGADLYGRPCMPELLRRLGRTGVRWIRLLYTYPAHVTPALMEAMAETEAVCPYLDMPLQHASDAVLRRMRRWGDRVAYERIIEEIRRRIPGVALRTTFIAGFPGETEKDVEVLLGFMEAVAFDHVGVFAYAREQGTPAASLPGQLPARERAARRALILQHQQAILPRVQARRLHRPISVLLERPGPRPGWWEGRTWYQAPEVDGLTRLPFPRGSPGSFVEAVMTGVEGLYDFVAAPRDGPLGSGPGA